jgi:cytoskeletal protein CcmA (bactofilin family)
VHVETASVCPSCGTTIHLHDITIHSHVTRPVHTRGTIHIEPEGYLNAMRVDCGNAIVEGRIAGRVTCEGTLRLRGEGICRAQIRTRRLMIDRGAELRFPFTIYADEVLIRGVIEADVHCTGPLHIGRTGSLEGDVEARAMLVDKGASYTGDVKVHAGVKRPEQSTSDEPDVRPLSGWHASRLAFG